MTPTSQKQPYIEKWGRLLRITFQSNVRTEHLNGCYFYTHMKAGDIMPDKDFDERIEKQNRQIAQWIWTVFVSVMASLVTALLYTR